MQPCYQWWEVPYYWAGLKAYDVVANFGNLAMSTYLTPSESLRRFPTLSETRSDGATLKGTVRASSLNFTAPFTISHVQQMQKDRSQACNREHSYNLRTSELRKGHYTIYHEECCFSRTVL